MERKKHFNNLSIYRILAASMVLLYHAFFIYSSADNGFYTIFSKFVQGLTFLSAFLYANKEIKNIKNFYLKNLIKILIPALLVIVYIVIYVTIYYLINIDKNLDYFELFWGYRTSGGKVIVVGNFWYIAIILLCYLMTPILARFYKTKNIGLFLLIILTIVLELVLPQLKWVSGTYLSYVLGYFISKFYYDRLVNNKYYILDILISGILLILSVIAYYYFITFVINNNYPTIYLELLNILGAIFGILAFIFIAHIFKFINNKEIKLFNLTDKVSYHFYLFNQLFMTGIFKIFIKNIFISYIHIFMVTALSSLVINYISNYLMAIINERCLIKSSRL